MENRIQINEVQPAAFKAMYGLETFLANTQISGTQKELIKLRASQINGCAFCIDMHSKDALKKGETPQRLLLLNAWKETDLFSEEEKAVLALTEEVTLIHRQGLSEATYQNVRKFFTEEIVAQLLMAVVTINAWNRIAIATHTPVPKN